ncbi:hypothetical protein M9Y10_024692 [Tritrichomonas musculus]|uniref:AAA-ATPase-like domain-containing protein n=1 Tax=Tritrichomonas musculus TaxID=1915356 RepID=A0ABR2HB07_9EUKA
MMFHMPSGQEDFKQLRENHDIIYIDKTHFIKEWWESSYDKVTLISRPRCFGKTLNISMIDYFFSNQYENLQYLFKDLFISNEYQIMNHQGQYPVIYLSFGDIKTGDSESIKNQIKVKIWQVYLIYKKKMIESDNLDISEKRFIDSITYQMSDDVAIHSIQYLCCFLNKIYVDKETIVLLDEYDSILTKSWNLNGDNGFWNDIKDFFINFMSSTFKDNKFMMRGLITGIMNIPLSFNFSCSNNINVYNMTSDKYWNCFGFTRDELDGLIKLYGSELDMSEIERWYGGYKCGKFKLFNPFSIAKFFNQMNHFSIYWINTSSNEIIKEVMKNGSLDIKDDMIELLQERSIQKELIENLPFTNFCEVLNDDSIWSLLVYTGYLTIEKQSNSINYSKKIYTLRIPNEEVVEFVSCFVNEWFEGQQFRLVDFINALIACDASKMEKIINSLFEGIFHFFNNSQNHPEIVYHAFVLGMVTHIRKSFNVTLKNINENGCFFVILKSFQNLTEKSFILNFIKKNFGHSNFLNSNKSDLSDEFEIQLFDDLQKQGSQAKNIIEFVFSFKNKECLINLKKLSEIDSELKKPDFDFNRKRSYLPNDDVFVIDKNGFDIFEAVVMSVTNSGYSIHYPDFPQNDEQVGIERIIDKSEKNIDIFKKQEENREKKVAEIIQNSKQENDS